MSEARRLDDSDAWEGCSLDGKIHIIIQGKSADISDGQLSAGLSCIDKGKGRAELVAVRIHIAKGIYKWDEDHLVLCMAFRDNRSSVTYPTSFKESNRQILFTRYPCKKRE